VQNAVIPFKISNLYALKYKGTLNRSVFLSRIGCCSCAGEGSFHLVEFLRGGTVEWYFSIDVKGVSLGTRLFSGSGIHEYAVCICFCVVGWLRQ
jgi:hypothetical protein